MTAYELAMNLIDNDREGTTSPITTAEAAAILADLRFSDEAHELDGITAEDLADEINTLIHTGKVILNSEEVDFEACVNLMDDEIREELHAQMAPCTEQEFLDAYIEAHAAKYDGEEFQI